jgi:hypothetical protein
LLGDVQHGQRGRRCGHVEDRVHVILIEPFARLVGGDIGLVLVIDHHQFYLLAKYLAAEVVDRHLRGGGTTAPGDVRVQAAHVEQ